MMPEKHLNEESDLQLFARLQERIHAEPQTDDVFALSDDELEDAALVSELSELLAQRNASELPVFQEAALLEQIKRKAANEPALTAAPPSKPWRKRIAASRYAVIAAIVALLFTSVASATIVRYWIAQDNETFQLVLADDETILQYTDMENIDAVWGLFDVPVMLPQWVPDDYQYATYQTASAEDISQFALRFENSEMQEMNYTVTEAPGFTEPPDLTHATMQVIDGMDCYFYQNEECLDVFWQADGLLYEITSDIQTTKLNDHVVKILTQAELTHIIRSIAVLE